MKSKLIFTTLVVLGVAFYSCEVQKQPVGSPESPPNFPAIPAPNLSLIPGSVLQMYSSDAGFLTMNYCFQNHLPDTAEVEFPKYIFESFRNGLLWIYLYAQQHQQRPVTKIHHFQNPSVHSILITVKSDTPWLENWRKGIEQSGNPTVDSLVQRYNLKVEKVYDPTHSSISYVTISSPSPLNTRALSRKFIPVEGVINASVNWVVGDGTRIEAEVSLQKENSGITYHLSIGWGDCPAGCIYHHYWNYFISSTGLVVFTGESGDPLQ